MPDAKWKEKIEKDLDKAYEEKLIDKETYDKLKDLLKKAKTAAGFARSLEKNDFLKRLAGKQKLGLKPFNLIIDILIKLVEAGPCPWTSIILARIRRLKEDVELDSQGPNDKDAKERMRRLTALEKKYRAFWNKCNKAANGPDKPKDVNQASVAELMEVGLSESLATRIVEGAGVEYFHSAAELYRVTGVRQGTVTKLLLGGFYFGSSMNDLVEKSPRKIPARE